ncbi:MAG TPA: sigma-70 family RNA polymerase sigma factor [Candidatus Paceibacterota bacterium]|nr:sigma-70 family RNA polymerase sigma factor [Candidatus Paceibacterota bacterium]
MGKGYRQQQFLKDLKSFEPILIAESHKYHIPGLEAEDIQQEVRLRLWIKYPTFLKEKSSFRTWANKVMKNCIKNMMRDAKRECRKPLNRAISLDDIILNSEYNCTQF